MTTKRFIKFQFIFLILLALTFVCNTFAWAPRPDVMVQGGAFMDSGSDGYYGAFKLDTDNYYINGNQCSAVTYLGTKDDATGEISYDTSQEVGKNTVFTLNDNNESSVIYFRTVITNDSDINTNVSLYLNLNVRQTARQNTYIGVTSPHTSVKVLSAESTTGEYNDVQWFPVATEYKVTENGGTIDWYIYSEHTQEHTFTINDIILTNN